LRKIPLRLYYHRNGKDLGGYPSILPLRHITVL
jgi:hypothetical protein